MKKLTPGTYLCYRKVGEDEWRVDRKLIGVYGPAIELRASKHPDRQWAIFEVSLSEVIDVEKTDL